MATERTLKQLVLRGSALEFVGYGAAQVLRLGSNLILSRLLFPEAFGVGALLTLLNQGLVMLTDMGIEQSVVQNPRGDDPEFLNTAWTMHIVRSAGLWLVACVLAWPVSVFYREPELLLLLPVSSIGIVLTGLASTSIFTLRRRVALTTLTYLELGTQVLGIAAMSALSFMWHSVWGLVIGGLVSSAFRAIVSHLLPVGYRNRLAWAKDVQTEILTFGKYIFASSAFSFVGAQTDRMLLGRFMGLEALGIYSIAVNLSDSIGSVIVRITNGVLFPAFSRVSRESGTERLRAAYYRARLFLDVFALGSLGGLMMCSDWLIRLLYDSRYHSAGWMLKFLCVRVALASVLVPCETCLFSMGYSRYGMYRNIARALWVLPGVPLASHYWGVPGVLTVIVTAEVPVALVLWPPFVRLKLFSAARELRALVFFGGGAALGALVNRGLMTWFPR